MATRIPVSIQYPWPCFFLAVPGVPDLFLVRDGGVAFALPPDLWRPAMDGGPCLCPICNGRDPAFWDTLRLHPNSEYGWTVHWPELQAERLMRLMALGELVAEGHA